MKYLLVCLLVAGCNPRPESMPEAAAKQWEISDGAQWGKDIIKDKEVVTYGDSSIKFTGKGPGDYFGMQTTEEGLIPVIGSRPYKFQALMRTNNTDEQHKVIVQVVWYAHDKKTKITQTPLIENKALPKYGQWIFMEVATEAASIASWARIQIAKAPTDFQFWVDYVNLVPIY
jgi:hypothetical protein